MWWVDIFGVTEEAVLMVASLVCVGGGETAGIFFSDPLLKPACSTVATFMALSSFHTGVYFTIYRVLVDCYQNRKVQTNNQEVE